MTTADWQSTIGLIGLPAVMILAIGYAAWKWGWYFLTEVFKPMVTNVSTFLDRLSQQIEKLVSSTDRMCDNIEKISETQSKHGVTLGEHGRQLEDIQKHIGK